MKRLAWVSLIVLLLCWSAPAGAGSLGGLGQLPGKGKFILGLQATWMAHTRGDDANLKSTLSNQGQSWPETSRIGKVKLDDDAYAMATLSYGLLDDLGLSLGAGVARGGVLTMDNSDAKLLSNFVWSLGAKYRLVEKGGVGIMLSARYLRYDDRKVADWRIDGQSSGDRMGYATSDSVDFYQVDGAASLYWKLGRCTPYLGAGFTYWEMSYQGKWNNPTNGAVIDYDATMRSRDWFTALAGLQLDLDYGLKLNLDGVFLGHTEVSLSLNYPF